MLYYSSKTTGLDLSSLTENLKLSNLLEAIQKVYILACLDLLYVMKNQKTTNISETMDIPSESSKEHLHKVLTFIGLIGAGYLTCPFIVQKLQVRTSDHSWWKTNKLHGSSKTNIIASSDLSNLMKNRKTTNLLKTIDIPSEGSKHHPYFCFL